MLILYTCFMFYPFLKISYSRTLVSPKTHTYYVLCKRSWFGLHANIFPLVEAGLFPALHQLHDHRPLCNAKKLRYGHTAVWTEVYRGLRTLEQHWGGTQPGARCPATPRLRDGRTLILPHWFLKKVHVILVTSLVWVEILWATWKKGHRAHRLGLKGGKKDHRWCLWGFKKTYL